MFGIYELIILVVLAGIPVVIIAAVALFFVLRGAHRSGHSNEIANMRPCISCQTLISSQAEFCSSCGKSQLS